MANKQKHRKKADLTRAHLASEVSDLLRLPRGKHVEEGTRLVNAILNVIIDALHRGEKVSIRGFGTFYVFEQTSYLRPIVEKKFNGIRSAVPITYKRKRVSFIPADAMYKIKEDNDDNNNT